MYLYGKGVDRVFKAKTFVLMLYLPVNNFSVMSGQFPVFLLSIKIFHTQELVLRST